MVMEIVESGSWSSNVWAEARIWRKREAGWEGEGRWIACSDIEG